MGLPKRWLRSGVDMKPPRRLEPSEHQIQSAFIKRMRLQHPEALVYAVPNAARRSMATAALLKAEGMRSGIPDVIIDEPVGAYHGLRIEFKTRVGRLTPQQRDVIEAMRFRGYYVCICRSADEAYRAWIAYRNNDLHTLNLLTTETP